MGFAFKCKRLFALLAASALLGGTARAEVLPSVLVTASALEEKSDLSSGTVTVIKPDDYEGEFRTLPDLLAHVPGVAIMKTESRGGYVVASVRGSTSSQVAVYIDGSLMNLGGDAAVDLSAIPPDSIERIEVYRGHVPGRFGVAGMGAVISIVTKASAAKTGQASAGVASFGEKRIAVSAPFETKAGLFRVDAEWGESDGDFPYRNDNGTPAVTTDDYDANRRSNGWSQNRAALSWEKDTWHAAIRRDERDRELPYPAPGADRGSSRSRATLNVVNAAFTLGQQHDDGDIPWGWEAEYFQQDKRFDDPDGHVGYYGQYHNDYATKRWRVAANAQTSWSPRHFASLRAEFVRETLDVAGDIVDVLGGTSSYARNSTSVTLENTLFFDDEGRFSATPLLRWNDTGGESALDWSVALRYQAGANWHLWASFGEYSRAPNFYELYGDGANVRPNPDLTLESGFQADIGVGGFWQMGSVDVTAELSAFYLDTSDLIEFVTSNPRYGVYRNIASARSTGVELEATARSGPWEASMAFTFMDAENLSPGYRDGCPLPNRPGEAGYLRLTRTFDGWLLFAEVEHTGKRYADDAGKIALSDLTTLDLGVKCALGQGVLALGVDNLTDERSMFEPEGPGFERLPWYPDEGRRMYLSYSLTF